MIDNKNLLMAIVLSVVILVGFDLYNKMMAPPVDPTAQSQIAGDKAADKTKSSVPQPGTQSTSSDNIPTPGAAPAAEAAPASTLSRKEIIAETPRITIDTPRIGGSISLIGGRIDDLTLHDYSETIDPNSPDIVLLHPKGAKDAYLANFGWVAAKGQSVKLPPANALWTADKMSLDVNSPVTLSWGNGAGMVFKKTISVDANYMFDVVQSVENKTGQPVTLHTYGLISRSSTPKTIGYYILHEGLIGVFDKTLKEVKYKKLQDEGTMKQDTTGGWLGFVDKYWLTALIPNDKEKVSTRFVHTKENGLDRYQADYLSPSAVVQPGSTSSYESRFFAGAKEVPLLDSYMNNLKIDRFDLAVDFGWFYFLTKPIFLALLWLHGFLGNFGVSILVLTVLIKAAFFPLANKSYRSMSKMKALQPEMTRLREQYGDDKARLNQEMMALYKREKANPAAGCLPMVVQIPVFFSLYKVLFVTIEMRHAPFFGWIHDLSAPDPTTIFNLFGLIHWNPPPMLMSGGMLGLGVWPIIMGITMVLQQKLNPQPADPVQAKIFTFLPIMFTFLLAKFPAGLVIYWAWNNSLSVIQQTIIMRRMGVKPGGGKIEKKEE